MCDLQIDCGAKTETEFKPATFRIRLLGRIFHLIEFSNILMIVIIKISSLLLCCLAWFLRSRVRIPYCPCDDLELEKVGRKILTELVFVFIECLFLTLIASTLY